MTIFNGSRLYSMSGQKEIINGKVYDDRDHRKQNWFLLDLAVSPDRRPILQEQLILAQEASH